MSHTYSTYANTKTSDTHINHKHLYIKQKWGKHTHRNPLKKRLNFDLNPPILTIHAP